MANCRFIRFGNNAARLTGVSTYPRLVNGGGYTGAPARVEDPNFPMENCFTVGRKGNVWVVPDGSPSNYPTDGVSITIELDVGSVKSITAVGLLGFSLLGNGAYPNTVYIDCIPNSPTYNAAGYVVQNGGASIVSGQGDGGAILPAPVFARFWRFRFYYAISGHGFVVAGLILATTITDLGFLYSSADETRVRPRALIESFDQSATLTSIGPEYARWTIQFDNNDAALRTTLDGLYGDREPFIFITPDLEWQECVWATEEFTRSHIWRPPDRYRMTVELRQLT